MKNLLSKLLPKRCGQPPKAFTMRHFMRVVSPMAEQMFQLRDESDIGKATAAQIERKWFHFTTAKGRRSAVNFSRVLAVEFSEAAEIPSNRNYDAEAWIFLEGRQHPLELRGGPDMVAAFFDELESKDSVARLGGWHFDKWDIVMAIALSKEQAAVEDGGGRSEANSSAREEFERSHARQDPRPILVFVDFDGVLHPAPPHNRDTGVFTCIDRFESVLRKFPACRIVISSSWRQTFDLETMRSFFSDDIAARIVGTTPVIDPEVLFTRQREIEQYMHDTNQAGLPWIALEDQPEEFEPELANVLLCDKEVGFDERAAAELCRTLGEMA